MIFNGFAVEQIDNIRGSARVQVEEDCDQSNDEQSFIVDSFSEDKLCQQPKEPQDSE